MNRDNIISSAKRVVVKIGSSLLLTEEGGPDLYFVEGLVKDIAALVRGGKEVILVSSGAIGMGRKELGKLKVGQSLHPDKSFYARKKELLKLKRGKKYDTISFKQALASIGQTRLVNMYSQLFQKYNLSVGQVLLNGADLSRRSSYLNTRNTFFTLLRLGIIPIVNENDTVAVEEIKFGDNDTLSALVAGLMDADLLIIFSDIKGLYTCDPRKNPEAQLIRQVNKISEDIEEIARDTSVEGRVGGMQTKIKAAKIATRSGIPVIIGGGNRNFLKEVFAGKDVGTLFLPQKDSLASRKKWIAYGRFLKGAVIVDEGAKRALVEKGGSLLPAGIVEVKGEFETGDAVSLLGKDNKEFARGIVYYPSQDIKKIKGMKSSFIESKLGYKYYDEVIHRDNLVIL